MSDAPSTHLRLHLFTWAFAAVLVGMGVRLVQVQWLAPVRAGEAENAEQIVPIPARRGAIYDVHGTLLAHSRFVYQLRADPVVLGPHAGEFARFAAPILGIPVEELESLLTPRPELRWREEVGTGTDGVRRTNRLQVAFTNRAVPVKLKVPPAEWESIRGRIRTNFSLSARVAAADDLKAVASVAPGFGGKIRLLLGGDLGSIARFKSAIAEARRRRDDLVLQEREIRANAITADLVEQRVYPLGGLAAHLLGHTVDVDRTGEGLPVGVQGAMGIELRHEAELRGTPGRRVIRTGRGRELQFLRGRDVPPENGLDIHLTIDARIQASVERALDEAIPRLQPNGIACVVMDPRTGELLALANRPTFDPNRYQEYPVSWRNNRALVVPFEPGSTFKMVTYAAALDRRRVTIDSLIDCEGGIWSPPKGRPVRDVEGHGLDEVTVGEAFAKSSNVAAAKLGLEIPIPVFRDYAEKLGYFRRSGILYHEFVDTNGLVVPRFGAEDDGAFPRERRINTEMHGRMSYGYSVMVTPIQTAVAAATIANGGRILQPQLVRRVTTAQGDLVRDFPPVLGAQAIRPETAEQMREMMRRVVTEGTGKKAQLEEFAVAGKTATAHKFKGGQQSSHHYTSTFVGFLPMESPRLCIAVVVDEPAKRGAGSHFGGTACGPIFQQIAREAAAYLALPPSLPATNQAATNQTAVVRATGGRRGSL